MIEIKYNKIQFNSIPWKSTGKKLAGTTARRRWALVDRPVPFDFSCRLASTVIGRSRLFLDGSFLFCWKFFFCSSKFHSFGWNVWRRLRLKFESCAPCVDSEIVESILGLIGISISRRLFKVGKKELFISFWISFDFFLVNYF